MSEAVKPLLDTELKNTKVVFKGPLELDYETAGVDWNPDGGLALIRTEYSLISPGTELALYTGTHVGLPDPANKFAKYPFYPGYSIVGRIAAVGSEVTEFRPGDRIYTIGRHAAYNTVDTQALTVPLLKLSDSRLDEKAAFARLAAISMTSVMQTDFRIGDTVVVIGMGLIGNLAAQLYMLQGARVIAVDVVDKRLQTAHETGIEHTILSGSGVDLNERVKQITGGLLPDVVVEATGSPQLVVPALQLVRELGQVIALGSTRGHVDLNVYEYIHRKGVRYTGAHEALQNNKRFTSRLELTRYVLSMIGQGALKVNPLLTHRLAYTEAKLGYEMLLHQQDQALGVLLEWTK
ncbi:zinc-dependent alcohol dehydrogenase [Paenibacillus piri]|nr:zinc-binding dehydrogenase [Paenibacillus piri]